ncbi:efflux RND transporter periplasmic adaptor subunit [Aetokthonos hydrillicola Thurmond2011]|jgi:cobalt-zinc-cadmium efflux system membrane fusion protein|uniref:Efflux RND transporter periplasmic adaptor subunit n=1 Tax=Aetokthonos hydrillicola Thurmond2011 TaxID=2712845 RepID=A0AAP5MB41_9CYAN|nr:efflux RND transporter periplasmic adaptor subunit [Aetokthonos hydrillicola]MBO3463756.1 efflux RND transporter periplasmic adaptor subunit [Aetokthonos hydrillicola CCALA 1050]MBW4587014.1 efflux RND transporter periplasmic adaptor subunit [Aetokthonos hydrillicola CCALA 1050]MDR9897512.1 efflux RND transporter periplasmic adaptor subunit [Aetokthonos hydrillicola Thurmond2011]
MPNSYSKQSIVIRSVSRTFLLLFVLSFPTVVLAHGGHGNEFQGESEATQSSHSIQVDPQTARRLGIKVEPVKQQQLAIGIKTTGQIETLPSYRVEVTSPISESQVIDLLVEPGAVVKKGQPVAVVTSPDLVTLRVDSLTKRAEAQADLKKAQADLKQAQQNYQKYLQIDAAEIAQAQSQVGYAQEKYDKDKQLMNAGAIPRRTALESQTQLAEAKAKLVTAESRKDLIDAENKLKTAQSSVELAKSKLQLSNTAYQTRLSQLGTRANTKGLVTVTSPIDGKVADREATIGQAFKDAGGKLMTIVNDTQVFATANIFEKDLSKVRKGQKVSVKVTSVANRTFTGRIAVIGSVVEGETRVIPVKAQIDNPNGVLKPGMFAELEVLTDKTSSAILAIPNAAVVDANGKKVVYVQSGNAYQPVEVSLGQTSGDMVEVKSGLFEGDMVVTVRAPQLYAQSLRGGNKLKEDEHTQAPLKATEAKTLNLPVPLWLVGAAGGAFIASVAFVAGRRSKPQVPVSGALASVPQGSPDTSVTTPNSSPWDDNHHVPHDDLKVTVIRNNTEQ